MNVTTVIFLTTGLNFKFPNFIENVKDSIKSGCDAIIELLFLIFDYCQVRVCCGGFLFLLY